MPLLLAHQLRHTALVHFRTWCTALSSCVTHAVAPETCGCNILGSFVAPILLRYQVLRCATQMLGLSEAYAVSSREFRWVALPHGKRAVEAAAALPNECLMAKFLKFLGAHGNSLGLTSKSPLTCIRMAGAVVQRIGGAWSSSNAVGGRESRASKF
jgi:hypothetical protein